MNKLDHAMMHRTKASQSGMDKKTIAILTYTFIIISSFCFVILRITYSDAAISFHILWTQCRQSQHMGTLLVYKGNDSHVTL